MEIISVLIGFIVLVVLIIVLLKSQNKPTDNSNNIDLQRLIDMAIADGVLTHNEKEIIREVAKEKNLDYDKIIADIENKLSSSTKEAETEIIDHRKKNGDDFEKFIAQKFNKQYFTIKEWAGDKYIYGTYAQTTQHPDLLIEFSLKDSKYTFSVECKWRQNLYKKGVEFAKKEQLNRYKDFQNERNIPVFIAIGIGGKGKAPEQLYIVPLKEISDNFIHISQLSNYEKKINNNFFFDIDTKELK